MLIHFLRWGVGCVFFEIVSLFPLFPGTNELDQIQKIHNILGTPPPELLAKMKDGSQHMDFNFPPKEGSGIPKAAFFITRHDNFAWLASDPPVGDIDDLFDPELLSMLEEASSHMGNTVVNDGSTSNAYAGGRSEVADDTPTDINSTARGTMSDGLSGYIPSEQWNRMAVAAGPMPPWKAFGGSRRMMMLLD
ncbi:hypothetical protein CEUSTIGMA_g5300.t1 [Chlamydomonas eustigma]|uniref:Protein kinase domain-containing protein n=1 Tax=Chlamydomonas eustigma TaxID=1157962 RepID=A0A250X449_9CHLO|nr:hypothetical protein CEUSTIGMA_g5300.t1 [Chlamydomonas eustigma]|eukprot:GAX77858.1 hypothetical protein CEUSTIGMA_g5300.t1 [Chlamydomonas eustigma]